MAAGAGADDAVDDGLVVDDFAGGDGRGQALLDGVMPKMLPLALVLICYALLRSKKVGMVPMLFGILAIGVVLSLLGIIG